MARRAKSLTIIAPETIGEADQYLRDIGQLDIQLRDIDTDLREATAKLKQEAEDQAAPLRAQVEAKWAGLQSWAQANRKRLTAGTKFIRLPSGQISWRTLPAKVSLKGVDDVIARLKSKTKWKKFLRVKYSVDKDAMLSAKTEASGIDGVTIGSEGETIGYEVDVTKLNPK